MFSVDNFYEIFNAYYAWPTKNDMLGIFVPHGSKNWIDVQVGRGSSQELIDSAPGKPVDYGLVVMHDQEPFFIESIAALRNNFVNIQQLPSKDARHGKHYVHKDLSQIAPKISPLSFLNFYFRTVKIPIICHSEKNSKDIELIKRNHWIDCYYWWHGMISRDWYRHWERHPELNIKNKSAADYRFLLYCRDFSGTRQYRTQVIERLQVHKNLINYNPDHKDKCATLSAKIDVSDANSAAIQIVAETLFDTEKIYLTEKVFKPMVMSQPFILFGPCSSLQYLRDYGFKTFNNQWDESYDLEPDSSKRANKIYKLIDDLSAMPMDKFTKLYESLLPILEHNRKRFYSQEFQDYLWTELQANYRNAVSQREQSLINLPGGTWVHELNNLVDQKHQVPERWQWLFNLQIERKAFDYHAVITRYPKLKQLLKHY